MEAYWATCSAVPGLPQVPSLKFPLLKEGSVKSRDLTPVTIYNAQYLMGQARTGAQLTTAAKFNDAADVFRACLQAIPISVAETAEEEKEITGLIDMCREYLTFLRLELIRKSLNPDTEKARIVELAAYSTCSKLQPHTLMLILRVSMGTAFKNGNFVTAGALAKRLVQGNFQGPKKEETITQARKVLQVCET